MTKNEFAIKWTVWVEGEGSDSKLCIRATPENKNNYCGINVPFELVDIKEPKWKDELADDYGDGR